jgi:hypothetical protein
VRPAGDVGAIEQRAAERDWPAVIAQIATKRRPLAHILANAAPVVAHDALVVEFPAGERSAMTLASKPENLDAIRRAVADVMGVRLPIRIESGTGATAPAPVPESAWKPVAEPAAPVDIEDYEPPAEAARPASKPEPADPAEIHAALDDLGAEFISEHDGG